MYVKLLRLLTLISYRVHNSIVQIFEDKECLTELEKFNRKKNSVLLFIYVKTTINGSINGNILIFISLLLFRN